MQGVNPAMIQEGLHGPQTWAADLAAGVRFKVEVSTKDPQGLHKGYGPGPTTFESTGPCKGTPINGGHERTFAGPKRVFILPEPEPAYPTQADLLYPPE